MCDVVDVDDAETHVTVIIISSLQCNIIVGGIAIYKI